MTYNFYFETVKNDILLKDKKLKNIPNIWNENNSIIVKVNKNIFQVINIKDYFLQVTNYNNESPSIHAQLANIILNTKGYNIYKEYYLLKCRYNNNINYFIYYSDKYKNAIEVKESISFINNEIEVIKIYDYCHNKKSEIYVN
jgi:hypothetical protein